MENTYTGKIKSFAQNNREESFMKTIKRLLRVKSKKELSNCKDLRKCQAVCESAKDYIRSEWTIR